MSTTMPKTPDDAAALLRALDADHAGVLGLRAPSMPTTPGCSASAPAESIGATPLDVGTPLHEIYLVEPSVLAAVCRSGT